MGAPELLYSVCVRPCLSHNALNRFKGIQDIAPPLDGSYLGLYLFGTPLEDIPSGSPDDHMESYESFGKQ